jgi:hypothetical protein
MERVRVGRQVHTGGRARTRCCVAIAVAAALCASVLTANAQSPGRGEAVTPQLEAFLQQLQRASQADDRGAVVEMIRYPITVSIAGLRVPFADAASVLSRYDDIFNPPLREAIAQAAVRQLTITSDRYVIGSSEVVIAPVGGQFRITDIRVPEFIEGSVAPTVPRADGPARGARPQEPRRIAIRVGPRPTQIPGLLARDAIDTFILYLPKGQLAGVRLERVPAGAAAIRVVHARTGTALGARPSADGRFVSGRPAESADYRIEVRRTGNEDELPLPYMLSLTLR